MKSVIDELMQVPLHRWLMVILYGIIVFVIIFKLIDVSVQFLVHTLAYWLSESYRTHVQPFGGYWGYLETQLHPRVLHSFISGWQRSIAISILISFILFIIILLTKSSKLTRFFTLSFFIISFLGWLNARNIVYDPFWTIVYIFIWLFCFILSTKVYSRLILNVKEVP